MCDTRDAIARREPAIADSYRVGSTGCSVTWLARLHGVQKVAGSNPVTPTYRTEDSALSRLEVNHPGPERAFRFLAGFDLIEFELDPIHEDAKHLPASCRFGNRHFFAQTPEARRLPGSFVAFILRRTSMSTDAAGNKQRLPHDLQTSLWLEVCK